MKSCSFIVTISMGFPEILRQSIGQSCRGSVDLPDRPIKLFVQRVGFHVRSRGHLDKHLKRRIHKIHAYTQRGFAPEVRSHAVKQRARAATSKRDFIMITARPLQNVRLARFTSHPSV
jgi:hypothetical protein